MSIKTGQTIYLEPLGNNKRHGKKIITAEVKEVKKKYFHVNIGSREHRFYIDGIMNEKTTDWGQASYMAHLTPEQANESAFRQDVINDITQKLRDTKYEHLLNIQQFIDENN